VTAYADDLMILTKGKTQAEVENYTNIETQKVAKWARINKIIFNDQKSKLMVIKGGNPRINGTSKSISITENYKKKKKQ
jgi:hypothetical protein